MTLNRHFALNSVLSFYAGMFGAVKPGFRSLALKLVLNVVGEL